VVGPQLVAHLAGGEVVGGVLDPRQLRRVDHRLHGRGEVAGEAVSDLEGHDVAVAIVAQHLGPAGLVERKGAGSNLRHG